MNEDNNKEKVIFISAIIVFVVLSIILATSLFLFSKGKGNKSTRIEKQRKIISKEKDIQDKIYEKPKNYKINKETGIPELGVHPEKDLKDMDDGEYDMFESNIINYLNHYDYKAVMDYIEKTYEKTDLSSNNEFIKNEKFYLDTITLAFLYGHHGIDGNEIAEFLKYKAVDERAIFYANMQMDYNKWTVKSSDSIVPATEDKVSFQSITDITNTVDPNILKEIKKYSPNYKSISLIEFEDDNSSYEAYFTRTGKQTEFITIKTDNPNKKTVNEWREKFKELKNLKHDTVPEIKVTTDDELFEQEADNLRNKLYKAIDNQNFTDYQKKIKKQEIDALTDEKLEELKDDFNNRKDVR